MKITVGNYELQLTARNTVLNESANTRDLKYFLNELSMVYAYAAENEETKNYKYIAEDYSNKANELYHIVAQLGLY